ncbi:MAG TPA: hypothetical protein VFD27_03295 [Chthoniobacteraceae bacterium]|nr:hypothetical protein [Chthoniobacteraceae bacterium]
MKVLSDFAAEIRRGNRRAAETCLANLLTQRIGQPAKCDADLPGKPSASKLVPLLGDGPGRERKATMPPPAAMTKST